MRTYSLNVIYSALKDIKMVIKLSSLVLTNKKIFIKHKVVNHELGKHCRKNCSIELRINI